MKTESAVIIKIWEILAVTCVIGGLGWLVTGVVNSNAESLRFSHYFWMAGYCLGSALTFWTIALGLRLLRANLEAAIPIETIHRTLANTELTAGEVRDQRAKRRELETQERLAKMPKFEGDW